MKYFSDFFYSKIQLKSLWIMLILYAVIGFGIIPYKTAQMQQQYGEHLMPFDLTFGYDKAFADSFLDQLGENGRTEYVQFVKIYDSIYPFIYGGLLLTMLTLLISRGGYTHSKWRVLNLLPILIVLVDFGENTCSIYNTTHFPSYSLTLLKIGSVLTQIKWSLVLLTFIAIIYFGFKAFKRRRVYLSQSV
ncbi:MAG: hypothetical protein R2760_01230 [Chitinophagales bacterium]|nr:hypothetical protein [Bacteroidota bacterium]MCB9074006.1 hypothetical protein [Chitinophagales bacterium]